MIIHIFIILYDPAVRQCLFLRIISALHERKNPGNSQCHSDKDDGKRTGTETGSGLFFC